MGNSDAGRFRIIDELSAHGVRAFVTTRALGSLSWNSRESASAVQERWDLVLQALLPAQRLATARQVHGSAIIEHGHGWTGWLRGGAADGHLTATPGTALGVSVADCVPVFIVAQSGEVALLHAGWRGTAAGILGAAVARLAERHVEPRTLSVHLGPAICGKCYEVGPEVHLAVDGRTVGSPGNIDLRASLAREAAQLGVGAVTTSPECTRCDNDQFFSHRAGDPGRQFAFLVR